MASKPERGAKLHVGFRFLKSIEMNRRIEYRRRALGDVAFFGLARKPNNKVACPTNGFQPIQTLWAASARMPDTSSGAGPKSKGSRSSPKIFHLDRPPM